MSTYLTFSNRDAVMLGSVRLPGILTSLQVSGTLEITQQSLSGVQVLTSIQGYSTCVVTLEITILGTELEREAQLRTINKAFYVDPPAVATTSSTGGNAQSFRVVNPHLDARRIRNVLFTKFDSREGDEDDSTLVTIELKELLSEHQRLQMAAQQSAAGSTSDGPYSLPLTLGGSGGATAVTSAAPTVPAPVASVVNGSTKGTP